MLTIEQQELVEAHVPHALLLARIAAKGDQYIESEFQSEACNALVVCALRYSKEMKCSFKAFVTFRINGSFKDFFRKRKKLNTERTNIDPRLFERGKFQEGTQDFEYLIEGLRDNSKEVLRLMYLKDYDYGDIGRSLNITARSAGFLIRRARKALKSKVINGKVNSR